MKNSKEIANELKELAPKLASLEKVNFHSAPENYFVNFKIEMLDKVKVCGVTEELKAVAPELAKLKKNALTEVPSNYFATFSADLLKKVRANEVADELKQIAPSLSQLEKENAFEVSANYFSGFPQKMMKRIALEEKSKAKSETPKWLTGLNSALENIAEIIFKPKYSFALAGVAATVVVGVMMFVKVEQCNDLDCKMASLTDAEINNYLDNNTEAYSDEIFEAGTDDATPTNATSVQFENEMLRDVSDADLNNALQD